jgi:6-pyruvoyltetrahydropterin/6-carboxytetrahydropterin synthase
MSYRISIERNTLRFAAAHMATFGGETEALHGHNYDVIVQMDGALLPDSWVIDFGEAKRLVREICQELDHKLVLAAHSASMRIDEENGVVTVETSANKRYVIPKSDVVMLEIDNTTAERLAAWFAGRIAASLAEAGVSNVTVITVGIEEMPGQAGWFTLPLGPERKTSRQL